MCHTWDRRKKGARYGLQRHKQEGEKTRRFWGWVVTITHAHVVVVVLLAKGRACLLVRQQHGTCRRNLCTPQKYPLPLYYQLLLLVEIRGEAVLG